MPLGMEVGLNQRTLCLMGTQPPSPKGDGALQFSANVYCGQTAVWIKMPLGTEVGLGPDDIVLDGDPATLRKKGTPTASNFWPIYCGQTAGWMKMPRGTEVEHGQGPFVLDGFPAIRKRGTAALPLFSSHVYCGHGCPSQLLLSSCRWMSMDGQGT